MELLQRCAISEILTEVVADPNVNLSAHATDATQTKGATFKRNSTRLYVPVVTLSINNMIKFLENTNQELKEQFLGINTDLKFLCTDNKPFFDQPVKNKHKA